MSEEAKSPQKVADESTWDADLKKAYPMGYKGFNGENKSKRRSSRSSNSPTSSRYSRESNRLGSSKLGFEEEKVRASSGSPMRQGSSRSSSRRGSQRRSFSNRSKHREAYIEDARNKRMLYGMLWLVGGVVSTAITFVFTGPDGRFVVFYGAIIYGVVEIFRASQ